MPRPRRRSRATGVGSRSCAVTARSSSIRWRRPGRCSIPCATPRRCGGGWNAGGRVLQRGAREDSDLFVSRLTKGMVITVFYPVGHDDLVLSGALPVEYLNDVLRADAPSDRIAVLYDREGRVIARSHDPAEFVGKLASPELRAHIAGAREGSLTSQMAGDARSFTAFTHLPNGWTSAIEAPREIVTGPMRAWEREMLLKLLAFAALAFVGAAAAGEWIARSIAQLAKAARKLGSGEIFPPVSTSLREVNDVGEALSRASQDRQRAEAAMRESDMRFRAIVDQGTAGISIVDLDGRFRFANRRHCEIT